jgi:hypothetical protein
MRRKDKCERAIGEVLDQVRTLVRVAINDCHQPLVREAVLYTIAFFAILLLPTKPERSRNSILSRTGRPTLTSSFVQASVV